jgi:hypothetical protein
VAVPNISDSDLCEFVLHAPTCLGDFKFKPGTGGDPVFVQDLSGSNRINIPGNFVDSRRDWYPIIEYAVIGGKLSLLEIADGDGNVSKRGDANWHDCKRKVVQAIMDRTFIFAHVGIHTFNDFVLDAVTASVHTDEIRRLFLAFSGGDQFNTGVLGPVVFAEEAGTFQPLIKESAFKRPSLSKLSPTIHRHPSASLGQTVKSFGELAQCVESSAYDFLLLYMDNIRCFVETYMKCITEVTNAELLDLLSETNRALNVELSTPIDLICRYIENVFWHHACHVDYPVFTGFRSSGYSPLHSRSPFAHDTWYSSLSFWVGPGHADLFRSLMVPVNEACSKRSFYKHYAPESVGSAINY